MIEIKNNSYGMITIGIDYYENLIADNYSMRATIDSLASILEVVNIPRKNIIKILREASKNV